MPERILPILVNYLRDNNNQVRKTSQAALLVLLEQGIQLCSYNSYTIGIQSCSIVFNTLAHPASTQLFPRHPVYRHLVCRRYDGPFNDGFFLLGLLDNADVNCQVCPILEELTAFESVDDFRTEAVALMTR